MSLMPKGESDDDIEAPAVLPCGRPWAASFRRVAANTSAGTERVVPSMPRRYGVLLACRAWVTAAASFGSRPAYSNTKFGPRDHSTTPTPSATAAAMPTSSSNRRVVGLRSNNLSWLCQVSPEDAVLGSAMETAHGWDDGGSKGIRRLRMLTPACS